MLGVVYRYELRRGQELLATGHLSLEHPLEVGDPVEIGRSRGIVRSIEPLLGESELRLVVQLRRDSAWPVQPRDWTGTGFD